MLDADQIKIKLIDFLIEQQDSCVIASEVPFYQGHRKADLIQLSSNKTTAFEIKSDRDNLNKLSKQLNDYNQTFSFCYLVTTPKHLTAARKATPSKTGIIILEDSRLKVVRRPLENKRLSKHSLALALSSQKINKLTEERAQPDAIHEKRLHVENQIATRRLKKYFYQGLVEKYQMKFKNFMMDRGLKTTLTDLYYLQSNY